MINKSVTTGLVSNEMDERIRLGKTQYKTEDNNLAEVEPMEEQSAPVVVKIVLLRILLLILLLLLVLTT